MRIPYPKQRRQQKAEHVLVRANNFSTPNSTCLGVILDRAFSYSTHITKLKAKTAARSNALKKLSDSKWGANPTTIRTTALAFAILLWNMHAQRGKISAHAHKVNTVLNDTCRSITGCLQPSNIYLYNVCLLAGIVPLAIRRSIAAQREREYTLTLLDIYYMATRSQRNV